MAGNLIKAQQEVARLDNHIAQLQSEHDKLLAACNSGLTLETKRMIFAAIGHTGPGYTGQGHWYQCSNCSSVYVVGESPLADVSPAPGSQLDVAN